MNIRDLVALVLTGVGSVLVAVGIGLWVAPGAGVAVGGALAVGLGIAIGWQPSPGVHVTRHGPVSFTRPDELADKRKGA